MSGDQVPENDGDVYPDGKLNAEDEGVTQTGIGIEKGKVILVWPKPVLWIGYDPDGAEQLAEAIMEKVKILRGEVTSD